MRPFELTMLRALDAAYLEAARADKDPEPAAAKVSARPFSIALLDAWFAGSRTMNGAGIDELISDVQARKARAIEFARRADCKRRELSAHTFLVEIKSHE
jgi:hypothetical protein